MIPPNVMFLLSMIPLVLVAGLAYWLLFWKMPTAMCLDEDTAMWKGPMWSHIILFIIIGVGFSTYWCCEGQSKYEQKYQQYQQQYQQQ